MTSITSMNASLTSTRTSAMNKLTLPMSVHPIVISADLIGSARKAENGFFSHQTDDEIAAARTRYAKWLALCQLHPTAPLAPARDIDEMWHLHMLSPKAYYRDCLANFGDLLDHDGGFGSEADEEPVLLMIFQRTALMWEDAYGEPYTDSGARPVKCTRNCVSRCTRACKSN